MMPRPRTIGAIALAASCACAVLTAQDQQPGARLGWPCAGRPDPTYFKLAEATGGQFFLFHPSEVNDSGRLMAASMTHSATVLRAGGQLSAGLHEFSARVDHVDSLLFSIAVQCLDIVEIVRPSGALLQASDPGVDYHQLEAGRIITLPHPDPGLWKVRVSGSRLFLAVIQANGALSLGTLAFEPAGSPRTGVTQVVRFRLGGGADDVHARLVTQGFKDLGAVPLRIERTDLGDEFAGEIHPPTVPFRLVITGRDADGLPFQRVHAQLFDPRQQP